MSINNLKIQETNRTENNNLKSLKEQTSENVSEILDIYDNLVSFIKNVEYEIFENKEISHNLDLINFFIKYDALTPKNKELFYEKYISKERINFIKKYYLRERILANIRFLNPVLSVLKEKILTYKSMGFDLNFLLEKTNSEKEQEKIKKLFEEN